MKRVDQNLEHLEGQKGNQADHFGMETSMVGDRVAKSPLVSLAEVQMGHLMEDY